MELKSPVTVRQTSVVPFEHPAQQQLVNENGEQMVVGEPSVEQRAAYIDNPYNNRGILRNYPSLQSPPPPPPQHVLALPPQQQQVMPMTRNVYLNRYRFRLRNVTFLIGMTVRYSFGQIIHRGTSLHERL